MLAVGGLLAFAGRVAVWRGALAVLVLTGAGSASASHGFVRHFDRLPAAVLSGQIAEEIARFEPGPAGNARRCALLQRFAEQFGRQPYSRFAVGELPQTHSSAERMRVTADLATEQLYRRPFCRAEPVNPALARLVRYAVSGGASAATHFGVGLVLAEGLHVQPVMASTAGFVGSVVVSYVLQHAWVFRSAAAHGVAGAKFLTVTAVAFFAEHPGAVARHRGRARAVPGGAGHRPGPHPGRQLFP